MTIKLVIARRPIEGPEHTIGLSRYSESIERALEGTEYRTIFVEATLRKGLMALVREGFIRPTREAKNLDSEDTVFHATDELCAVFFPKVRGRKILTVHHITKRQDASFLFYHVWHHITTRALSCSDVVIAISDSTRRDLLDMGVPAEKIVCITNEINPAFRKIDVQKKRQIFCLAELTVRKNVEDSVRAFSHLVALPGMGDLSIVICGDGPSKPSVESVIRECGIEDKVTFVSRIPDEDIVRYFNESLAVFNTSTMEGLGLITIESQRCGTPVFHLSGADIPEIVTKMSIACENAEDMATKACALISDSAEYERVVAESKEYADSFGKSLKDEYLSIIKRFQ